MGHIERDILDITSHELRNPIMAILGITEILNEDYREQNKHEILIKKEYVESIVRNVKRLERLAEEMLDVTRIECGMLMLTKEEFIFNDVITDTIENIINNEDNAIDAVYWNKEITQIRYTYNELQSLIADRSKISLVISNLLSNALKFTKDDGIIVIDSNQRERNCITLTIRDSGQGIDNRIFPQLFSKFVTNSYQGIGLGLFISKKIIEAHNGRIWAMNNQNGQGATFGFSLPMD